MIDRLPSPNNGTGFVNNYQAQGTEDYKRDNNDFKVTYQPGSNFTLFGPLQLLTLGYIRSAGIG